MAYWVCVLLILILFHSKWKLVLEVHLAAANDSDSVHERFCLYNCFLEEMHQGLKRVFGSLLYFIYFSVISIGNKGGQVDRFDLPFPENSAFHV